MMEPVKVELGDVVDEDVTLSSLGGLCWYGAAS